MAARASATGRGRSVQLTDRDRDVLSFLAEQRLALADQVQALVGTSPAATNTRLRALAAARFLTYRRIFHGQPACCQVTRKGLAAIGSRLPPPRLDLACYRHDVGAAWLWLAAGRGAFGALRETLGERRMRSHDRTVQWPGEPYGVRVGGFGRDGRERLHYPDLLLIARDGGRTALELELTAKGATRRERIMGGYAADGRIDRLLYLVENNRPGRAIGRSLEDAARDVGIGERLTIRHVRPLAGAPLDAGRAVSPRARELPEAAR